MKRRTRSSVSDAAHRRQTASPAALPLASTLSIACACPGHRHSPCQSATKSQRHPVAMVGEGRWASSRSCSGVMAGKAHVANRFRPWARRPLPPTRHRGQRSLVKGGTHGWLRGPARSGSRRGGRGRRGGGPTEHSIASIARFVPNRHRPPGHNWALITVDALTFQRSKPCPSAAVLLVR